MLFEGANATPAAIAAELPLITRSNYLDRNLNARNGKLISGVANFGALRYAEVYPGSNAELTLGKITLSESAPVAWQTINNK